MKPLHLGQPVTKILDERNRLTPRQQEILHLLAGGWSTKEVAFVLDISVRTAENHRANILRNLDLRGMAGLVRYAVRNKIIEA